MGRVAWIGAASATVGWGVGYVGGPALGDLANGVSGGVISAATGGGNILKSALIGGGTSLAFYAVTNAGSLANAYAGQVSLEDPILLAQKGDGRRGGGAGRIMDDIGELIEGGTELSKGLGAMQKLDIIRNQTELLELQVQKGVTRDGHIYFDAATGQFKGKSIGPSLWNTPVEDNHVIIHGREPRPGLK